MFKTILFIVIMVVALLDWLAVARGWKKVEYLAKPATMVCLMGYLGLSGGLSETPLSWFELGLFLSLAGDTCLMFSFYRFSNRWFLPGLVAFLLAHVAYIIGFNMPSGNVSPVWGIGIAIILAYTTARVLRRILSGVREKGLTRMVAPVVTYGTVITLMLLSAMLTPYRVDWNITASALACLGAILFYFSDIILAWNKFVNPVKNGRLLNMIAYHLGQIALITGVVLQFGK